MDPDAQDLAPQVVRVAGGFLGIKRRPARALVQRGVAARLLGAGVVAGGDIHQAVRPELDGAGRVAAGLPLGRDLQNHLFRPHLEAIAYHLKPRHVLLRHLAGGGIAEVNPAVAGEIRVQGHA